MSLYHCNILSIPSLSLSSLLENLSAILMPHIHLIILISACWSVNLFSFFTAHVSLPCNTQLRTQLVYNFPLVRSNSWFPPSRNVGNVGNVRNLINVGRWRNGHTLRTSRENMETKLHQWFLLVYSYGFHVKNRNWFYSYRFHVYVTFCHIRENVYVKIFTYAWFFMLPTLTTYVTWRWKSRVRHPYWHKLFKRIPSLT